MYMLILCRLGLSTIIILNVGMRRQIGISVQALHDRKPTSAGKSTDLHEIT